MAHARLRSGTRCARLSRLVHARLAEVVQEAPRGVRGHIRRADRVARGLLAVRYHAAIVVDHGVPLKLDDEGGRHRVVVFVAAEYEVRESWRSAPIETSKSFDL